MAVISIHYNETNPDTYENVSIHYDNLTKIKVFDSKDFVKDWFQCNMFIINELLGIEPFISNSSSVDHFFMDGAKFKSIFPKLNPETNRGYLTYEYDEKGMEFFIEEDKQYTWEELKERCEK